MQIKIDYSKNLDEEIRRRFLFVYEEFLVFFSDKTSLSEKDMVLAKQFLKYFNDHAELMDSKNLTEYRTILKRLEKEYPQIF